MAHPKPAPYDTTQSFRRQAKDLHEATCHRCKVSYVWDGDPTIHHALCSICGKPIRGAGKAAHSRTGWVCRTPRDETAPPPPEPEPSPQLPPPPPRPIEIVKEGLQKAARAVADTVIGREEEEVDREAAPTADAPQAEKEADPKKKRNNGPEGQSESEPSDAA